MSLGTQAIASANELPPDRKAFFRNEAGDQLPKCATASTKPNTTSNVVGRTATKSFKSFARICPHQILSFERFQHVANLPTLQDTHSLDVLIKLSPSHHAKVVERKRYRPHDRLRRTKSDPEPTTPQPCSYVSFRNAADLEAGFELVASWEVLFFARPDGTYAKDDMQRLLRVLHVWLCPHIRLDEYCVVDTMFGLLSAGDIEEKSADQERAKRRAGLPKRCTQCDTTIQVTLLTEDLNEVRCHVEARRNLGQGQSENDPCWSKQCARAENDRKSSSNSRRDSQCHCGVQFLRGIINPSTLERV